MTFFVKVFFYRDETIADTIQTNASLDGAFNLVAKAYPKADGIAIWNDGYWANKNKSADGSWHYYDRTSSTMDIHILP